MERDELIERFRADLHRPLSERYYSEDELLEIFDTAGDEYDDYLRSEVLLLGAHLYPDSRELLGRRAIFYRQTNTDAFNSFLGDNLTEMTPLWEILRLATLTGPTDAIVAEIERFIDANRLEEDEEVIQFVQAVHSLGLDSWLVKNLERVRAKVSYLPTLLYEIAVTAEESTALDAIAIRMLEELTEIEPYSPEYWTMLAYSYLNHDRLDDARTALDYALAISPDNVEALKIKLRTLDDADGAEIDSILDRLADLDPADPDIALLAVMRADEAGDRDRAHRLLDKFRSEVKSSRALVAKAIALEYEGVDEMLMNLYDSGIADREEWLSLAEVAYATGEPQMLNAVLRVYQSKSGEALNHDYLLARMLFVTRQYELAVNMFINADESGTLRRPEHLYVAYSQYLLILLRLGRFDEAREGAQAMKKMLDTEPSMPGTAVERYGASMLINDIIARLDASVPTDWTTYDPLGLDKGVL